MSPVLFVSAAALLFFSGMAEPAATAPAAATTPAPAAGRADNEYQKLVTEKAAAIVTIKFVMKVQMGGMGEDRESEEETFGVMMDGKGTVLVSNLQMGGMLSRMGRSGITATATQVKVLIGDDTEGVEAKLVARDSELDLAWVKIEKPAEKPYVFVDFNKSVDAKLGDPLVYLDRTDKFFDRVPMVSETRVGAEVRKPRHLFLPSDGGRHLGTAVFNSTGVVIGFATVQLPAEDDQEGGGRGFRGAAVVLPASDVVSATERAMKNPDGGDSAEKKPEGTTEKTEVPEKK